MNGKILAISALITLTACFTYAAPNADVISEGSPILSRAERIGLEDDSDESNMLFPYHTLRNADEIERRSDSVDSVRKHRNTIPRIHDLERESSSPILPPIPPPKLSLDSDGSVKISAAELEKLKSIAFNNREVKLVGADRKEVELKSDVATQMMIALDNLQKEATDVWGQVNVRLDKGWKDFKSMVETAVNKNNSPNTSSRQLRETSSPGMMKDTSSLVMVSDSDGYSMADEGDLSKQAETAGAKIKGFFSNIGINEENGKKANEALSKAGASVSETVTKDLPDALKKAGTAIGDTVTKDIPEAFKNFFG